MVPTVSVITVRAACAFFPRPRPLVDAGFVVIGGGGSGGGVSSLGSFTGGGGDGEGGGGGVGSLGGDGVGIRGAGGGVDGGDGMFSSTSEFEGLLDNGVEFFVLGLRSLEKENKRRLTQKACRHKGYSCKRRSLWYVNASMQKEHINNPKEKEL